MKVREVIERLNSNESLAVIANQLNISPYLLSKKLRLLGYGYDSKNKKRVFVGEGEQFLDMDILDVSLSNTTKKLSYDELIYKELVRIRMHIETLQKSNSVVQVEGDRIRRSFTIEKEVLKRLDAMANVMGMHKSRIVEAAIIEWLDVREK